MKTWKSGLSLAPRTSGQLVHTQTHQHWRHLETSKRVCERVCEYMCDTRGVTSIPGIRDIFTLSFTEAPRLSARQEVLFGVDLWSLWFPVVFDSLGSMLHHFPSEADEQCHCPNKGEFTRCLKAQQLDRGLLNVTWNVWHFLKKHRPFLKTYKHVFKWTLMAAAEETLEPYPHCAVWISSAPL